MSEMLWKARYKADELAAALTFNAEKAQQAPK